jgi:hypothetical protein
VTFKLIFNDGSRLNQFSQGYMPLSFRLRFRAFFVK